MGNCRSRTRRITTHEELLEKYDEAEKKLIGVSAEIQKAMRQLYVIESKIQTLREKLEKEENPETIHEKVTYAEKGESPFKNTESNAISVCGVTKKITKMDLTFSQRKKKALLQKKLQHARDRAKEDKINTSGNLTGSPFIASLGTINKTATSNNIFGSLAKDLIGNSQISTPCIRLNGENMSVKEEYVDKDSLKGSNSLWRELGCDSLLNTSGLLDKNDGFLLSNLSGDGIEGRLDLCYKKNRERSELLIPESDMMFEAPLSHQENPDFSERMLPEHVTTN